MDVPAAATLKVIVSAAFVGTWIGLTIAGLVISPRMNAEAKRRWFPRGIILVGTLFVFYSTTLTLLESRAWSSLSILFVVIPIFGLISYLNIKFTKFCDKCGATLYNANWLTPQRFCSKCGAKLESVKPSTGRSLLE